MANRDFKVRHGLNVCGNSSLGGNVTISGALSAESADLGTFLSVSGTGSLGALRVAGMTSLQGGLVVDTSMDVQSAMQANTISASGQLKVQQQALITGQASVGGTLKVTGASQLATISSGGQLKVLQQALITGQTSVGGTLKVTGDTTLCSALEIKGNASINGTTVLNGGVQAKSGLDVSGHVQATGHVSSNGYLHAGTYLQVSGTGSLGALRVAGMTSLQGGLVVDTSMDVQSAMQANSISASGQLQVNGTTSLKGSLTVSGMTSLQGGLVVDGESDFQQKINVNNISSSGTLFIAGSINPHIELQSSASGTPYIDFGRQVGGQGQDYGGRIILDGDTTLSICAQQLHFGAQNICLNGTVRSTGDVCFQTFGYVKQGLAVGLDYGVIGQYDTLVIGERRAEDAHSSITLHPGSFGSKIDGTPSFTSIWTNKNGVAATRFAVNFGTSTETIALRPRGQDTLVAGSTSAGSQYVNVAGALQVSGSASLGSLKVAGTTCLQSAVDINQTLAVSGTISAPGGIHAVAGNIQTSGTISGTQLKFVSANGQRMTVSNLDSVSGRVGTLSATKFNFTSAGGQRMTISSATITSLNVSTITVNQQGNIARRISGTVASNNSSYVTAFTVNGNNLASCVEVFFEGTIANVVVACYAEIVVNHSGDITIRTHQGQYTPLDIQVISSNNEDFAVLVKRNGGVAGTANLNFNVYPKGDETVTATSTNPYSGTTFTHTGVRGTKITATGGNTHRFETDGQIIGDGQIVGKQNLTISGMTSLQGGLVVDTSMDVQTLLNADNISASGTLKVQGSSVLSGKLTVKNNLSVVGSSILSGAVQAKNTLSVGGSGTIGGQTWANGWFRIGNSDAGIAMDPNEIYFAGQGNLGTLSGNLALNPAGNITTNKVFDSTANIQTTAIISGTQLRCTSFAGTTADIAGTLQVSGTGSFGALKLRGELDFDGAAQKYIDFMLVSSNASIFTANFRSMDHNSQSHHQHMEFQRSGAVKLYHNNDIKAATRNTGFYVSGTLCAQRSTVSLMTVTTKLLIDSDNQADGALRIENNVTNPDSDFYFAEEIISNLSGTTSTANDREQGGIYMDINSSATGGDTNHEHRAYGMYIDLDSTGDSDLVYGIYSDATATPTTGTTTEIAGVYGRAEDNGGAGNVTTLYGVRGLAVSDNSNSDTNSMYGGYFKSQPISDTGDIGAAYGVYAEIEIPDGTGDHLGNSYVVRAVYDDNDGVAQSNTTYLFHGDYTGTNPTNAYGVYIAEPNADNYFAGFVGINETGPLTALSINTYGNRPTNNGNTFPYPAGNWVTNWGTNTGNADYWAGFGAGGYGVTSGTVNIALAPNHNNTGQQAGMYIAGEATSASSSVFTIGKIVGGSATGASSSAGNQRATKHEFFRITSDGDITTSSSITTQTSTTFYENNRRVLEVHGGTTQGWLALGATRTDTDAYVGGINFINRHGQIDNHRFLGYIRLKSTHVNTGVYGTNVLKGQLEFATKSSSAGISATTPDMVISPNGSVGIGTNNPTGKLQVGSATGSHVIITENTGVDINDGAINLYQATTNVNAAPFIISTDVGGTETEKLRVTGAGFVGIGTDAPISPLDILLDSGTGDPRIRFDEVNDDPFIELNRWTGGGTNYYGIRAKSRLGDLALEFANSIATIGSHTYSEKLRITSGGNIGIGTDAPGGKLDVRGYVRFGPSSSIDEFQGLSLTNGRNSGINTSTSFIDFKNDNNIADSHIFAVHQPDGRGELVFGTTPVGDGDRTTDRRQNRLILSGDGHLLPTGNGTQEIGSSSTYWNKIYVNAIEGASSNITSTGNITISKTSPKLILNDTNTTTGSYPEIQFDTNNNQGVTLRFNEFDGELPQSAGYGLILQGSPNNTQFPGTGTVSLTVLGEIYTGAATTTGTYRVLTTNDEGSGNGLDADTVDGLQASSLLRSNANDTFTGTITGATLHLGGSQITSSAAVLQVNGFMRTGSVYIHQGGGSPNTTSKELANASGELLWENQKVWNAGNDGAGSGLDADLLDGSQKSAFVFDRGGSQIVANTSWDKIEPGMYGVASSSTFTGTNNPESTISGIYRFGVLSVFEANGQGITQLYTPHTGNKIAIRTGWNNGGWYGWQQVWTSTSDGSGSGLDADLLDGINSGSFVRSDANDSLSGEYTFTNTSGNVKFDFTGHAGASQYNYFMRAQNDGGVRGVHFVNGSTRSSDGGPNTYTIRNDGGSLRLGRTNYATLIEGSTFTYNSNTIWHAGTKIIYTGSDDEAIRLSSATHSSDTLYIGGWSTANSNNIHRIRCSSNLHIDSAADGDLYLNWYSGKEIRINGHARFQDNKELRLGTSSDLRLYHNSSNSYSYIDNLTGSLYIRGASGNHIRIQALSGEESIVAAANGSVQLYYDNGEKLSTNSTGVYINGGRVTFPAHASDAAFIRTVIDGTTTHLDFYLSDDNNADTFRWRFNPSSGSEYNAMVLKPVSNGKSRLELSGDLVYNNNAIVAAYPDDNNIDHIWHDDASVGGQGGAWNFCSDTTYKNSGNSAIRMGKKLMMGTGLSGIATNRNAFIALGDGDTGIAQNGDGVLELVANNSVVVTATSGSLTLNGELNLMGSSDGNKYMDVRVGSSAFHIRRTSGGDSNHEVMARFTGNSGVDLYHNNIVRLTTTLPGVQIEGRSDNYWGGMDLRSNYASASNEAGFYLDFKNENNYAKSSIHGILLTSGESRLRFLLTASGVARDADNRTQVMELRNDEALISGNIDATGSLSCHAGTVADITTRVKSGFFQDGGSATTAEGWPQTTNTWYHLLSSTHSNTSNYYSMQFAGSFYNSTDIYYRSTNNSGTTAWNKLWHAGNDGSGTGLDADLLDGQHGSYYQNAGNLNAGLIPSDRVAHNTWDIGDTTPETGRNVHETGIYTFNVNNNNLGTGTDTAYYSVLAFGQGAGGSAQIAAKWTSTGDKLYYRSLRDTTDDWWNWKEILHSGSTAQTKSGALIFSGGLALTSGPGTIAGSTFENGWLRIGTSSLGYAFDNNEMVTFGACIVNSASGSTLTYNNRPAFNGGASGTSSPFTVDSTQVVLNLNADEVDGYHAASLLKSNESDVYDGQIGGRVLRFRCVDDRNAGSTSGNLFPLEIFQNSNTTNSDAAMAFHISGRFATYFGLNRETNDLFTGGWSDGSTKHKIFHAGNIPQSGGWFSGTAPMVRTGDGVMEIGRYIDFHTSNTATADYNARLDCRADGFLKLTGAFESTNGLFTGSSSQFFIASNGLSNLGTTVIVGNCTVTEELNLIGSTSGDTNKYLDAQVGNGYAFHIRRTTNGDSGHQNMAVFRGNAEVALYHNNSEKFKTESSGVRVFGRTRSKSTSFNIGSSADGYKFTNNGVQECGRNTSSGNNVIIVYGGSGEFKVKGDGDCLNTNNNYGGTSDVNLKENIVDANSQWDDIKDIRVRNYNFRSSTGISTHTQIGVIAQEIELVSPGLVNDSNEEDDDGNIIETTKTVAYSVLYMKAVKALQEAMERIETLESKVAALESDT